MKSGWVNIAKAVNGRNFAVILSYNSIVNYIRE
jgi:hypothetical protein